MSAAQFIKPKTSLSAKVGRVPTFDPQALARAEAALNDLSSQFDDWMKAEADKLGEARDIAQSGGWTDTALSEIFTRAHDIKGLGTTYKFPIASKLAGSLCLILEAPRDALDRKALARLVSGHVDTIRAVGRDGVRDETHPVARALLGELSALSTALLSAR